MSEQHTFKVGQFVKIVGKQLEGHIAYIGVTNFAAGKWIGIILTKPYGKNNGTIRGKQYFKCSTNYGIFVRPTQLLIHNKRHNIADTINMSNENSYKNKMPKPSLVHVKEVEDDKTMATPSITPKKEKTNKMQKELNIKTMTTNATKQQNNSDSNSNSNIKNNSNSNTINMLKTTKINQPKEVKSLLPSTSQLSLVNVTGVTCRVLRPPPPPPSSLAPKRSKTSMSPSDTFCCGAKRSSFVETGFLEILRPQFTPGQPLRSPTFSSMALSSSSPGIHELQQQNKQLEAKLNDLQKEIDTLKQQKTDDKRKLMEMERLRLQNDQLNEFKVRIMDQQTSLQRELQRLRQELRESIDAKIKSQRELDEAAESIELLTLDKELAEEKAETIQIELEMAQEQNEELSLDLEILKAENERFLIGNNSNNDDDDNDDDDNVRHTNNNSTNNDNNILKDTIYTPSIGEVKKLQQYNQRLRETVIKLRDVLTDEKQQSMKAIKELETRKSEIAELQKTKELLTKRCDVMETHIIDLREQVDASLGAETMVTTLADSKLELEDRVHLLEEEVAELEALEEIHEQLIESNQELERDLREEIELLNGQVRTLQQEKDMALETLYERDCTIMKFRVMVKSLKETTEPIKEQIITLTSAAVGTTTNVSTSEDMSSISSNQEFIPGIDFQQVFASTKAYGRALDLQLAGVEQKILQRHIDYLKAFLPEELLLRGGAHDIILVLLLLQRCLDKLDIICSGIHEKFPASCEFGRDAIFEGFSVHRFAFRTKCLYLLRSIRTTLQQMEFALNHCDYDVCTHAAIYRNEMELHEKQLDDLLQLLKKGLLDENTPVEGLERAINFFNNLFNNLLATQNFSELLDEQRLYISLIEVYDVAFDCINTHAGLLYTIIQLGDEHTDSFCSMQFLMENAQNFKQQLKQMQRKFPMKSLGFNKMQWTQMQCLTERNDYLNKLINLLSTTAREATRDIAAATTTTKTELINDIAIDHDRLWRILLINCNRMAIDEGFQQTPIQFFQNCTRLMQEQLDDFQRYIDDNENARTTNLNTVYVRSNDITILHQAHQIKRHYDEVKMLHYQLEEKDKEIRSLKQMAKMKQNDYSELQIRRDMAEKHLQKQTNDQEHLLQQLGNDMEDLLQHMQTRQYNILQALQAHEQRLKKLEITQNEFHQSFDNNARSICSNSNYALQEIEQLQKCLRQQRVVNCYQQSERMKMKLKQMQPLYVPQQSMAAKAQLNKLTTNLQELKNSWILNYITIKNGKSNKSKSSSSGSHSSSHNIKMKQQLQQQQQQQQDILMKSSQVSQLIWEAYAKTHRHRFRPSEFGTFPTMDLKETWLKYENGYNIGYYYYDNDNDDADPNNQTQFICSNTTNASYIHTQTE